MNEPIDTSRNRLRPALSTVLLALCLTGCERTPQQPPPQEKPDPKVAHLDAWLGRWNGPEGTFLELKPAGDQYALTIQNLDGPKSYTGREVGNHLEFDRDGQVESIQASNGDATGMKWLIDKQDCLTIRRGEGFCRD
ncbi:MAG: hypothetical protein ACREUE_07850 [Panacagrimonas sp.]